MSLTIFSVFSKSIPVLCTVIFAGLLKYLPNCLLTALFAPLEPNLQVAIGRDHSNLNYFLSFFSLDLSPVFHSAQLMMSKLFNTTYKCQDNLVSECISFSTSILTCLLSSHSHLCSRYPVLSQSLALGLSLSNSLSLRDPED